MNKTSAWASILFSTIVVGGCGGGGDDEVTDPRTNRAITFIDWGGPSGETVKDGEQKEYKFTASDAGVESCLFDVKAETVITDFCHAVGQSRNRYLFLTRYIDVRRVNFPDGSCSAAMVDVQLGGIVDVFIRDGGVTVIAGPDPVLAC